MQTRPPRVTNIPIATLGNTDSIKTSANEQVLRPNRVEVLLEPHIPAVSLKIEMNDRTVIYPLSLPTVMQLAKCLRRTVCDYLNGSETE